jgi:ankyrin repeat protein
MLKRGFDINSIGTCDEAGYTKMPPIIFAMWHFDENESEVLNFVLKHNPNLNIKYGSNEDTPLMIAMGNEEYDFAELLLNAGLDLTIKNRVGCDAFDMCDNQEFRKKLFSKLEIVNVGDLIFRETKKGNNDFVKELNEFKVGQHVPLKQFILDRIATNNLNIIERLIDDIKTIFKSEYDQHDVIIKCTSSEMLNLLLKQGFDINSRSMASHTPLIHSTCMMNTTLAKLLMSAKPNIDLVTANGNTALGVSIMYYNYDIAEMLLDAKADITIKNKNGRDLLQLCKDYVPHKDSVVRWKNIKSRIEKLVSPPPVELKTEPKSDKSTVMYINGNGNVIEIPEIKTYFVEPYWDKDLNPQHVNFDFHPIKKNNVRSARRLDSGKWINCEITFPNEYAYSIKIPQNFKPKFHIINASSGFSSIQGDMIVRFDDFEYV